MEQINITHTGILGLLDDPGNPLYAKPHSMAKPFDAMMVGAHSIGELPSWGHCRGSEVATRMYEDEARQVCQKILRCLDVRVPDGDLFVLTCVRTHTLILPAGCFIQMYYNSDAKGRYASQFPSGGQGFLQPMGDIRMSIVPRNFRVLPANVPEVIDESFHREELENRADLDEDQDMSTDRELDNCR